MLLKFNKSIFGFLATIFIGFTSNAQYVIERVDINPGPGNSTPGSYVGIDSLVYFFADDGTTGNELWTSDGTVAGTKLIKDINPGTFGSSPQYFIKYKNKVFFAANDGTNGNELWVTDGTPSGTQLLKDIRTGAGSSNPVGFAVVKNMLLFKADDGTNGRELWVTDGTANGTVLVKDIRAGAAHSDPGGFIDVNGTIIFIAYDGSTRNAIWTTDGTPGGTKILTLIGSSNATGVNSNFVMYNGKCYFSAEGGSPVFQSLWETDGTANGTKSIISYDLTGGSLGVVTNIVVINNKMFFGADSTGVVNDIDREPWISDGTASGTHRLKNIHPNQLPNGLGGYIDYHIATVNDSLAFFVANDSVHGPELWVSNGTENGTNLVADIRKQKYTGSMVQSLTPYAGKCFFDARDTFFANPKGGELYVTDGTPSGTKKILAQSQGSTGFNSSADEFAVANGSLFLRGSFDTTGYELWIITDTAYNNKDTTHNPGSVNAVTGNTSFKLSPNPASDRILLAFDKMQNNGLVTITDISGRIVKKISIDKPTETMNINLHNIPGGTYIISLENADGVVSEKILIE